MKGKAGMNNGRKGALTSRLDLKIRPGMETGRDYRALHRELLFHRLFFVLDAICPTHFLDILHIHHLPVQSFRLVL